MKECVQNTDNVYYENSILVTRCMVQNAIDKLKSGKACGHDGLSAENYIHPDSRIIMLMSIFYNKVISHGYLPGDFMKTSIIPFIKDKSGDMSHVNDYVIYRSLFYLLYYTFTRI